MRLRFDKQRVLAVVAHPDDAELLCAGALAKAKDDQAEIGICVLCRGDKGQTDPPIENLAEVRSRELTEATKLLGAELFQGGFGDGELVDDALARKALIEIYRQFRPTLVLAHSAEDYHPDHRAASALAEAASWFCASRGHQTDSPAIDAPPALWWMDVVNMAGFTPEFYIDVSQYIDIKRRMIRCHQSQLARGQHGDFSPLEDLMLQQCQARGAQSGVEAAEAFRLHHAWKRLRAW